MIAKEDEERAKNALPSKLESQHGELEAELGMVPSALFSEYPSKQVGPVTHDGVDPQGEHATHFVCVIYRPHMHLNAMASGRRHETPINDREGAMAERNLERLEIVAPCPVESDPTREPEIQDSAETRARWHAAL